MASVTPSNQVPVRVGNTFSVSAFLPGTTGPGQATTFCVIITFPGIPYVAPPNVLLTSASVHFIASPIWIETNRFGLCVDRKTPPASVQSLNIYMLIQGMLAPTATEQKHIEHQLYVTPVKDLEELLRLGGL
jgi:hypothetical protein